MQEPIPPDRLFQLTVGTLASASLACWFVLARRRPILPYVPRQPVPWNAVATLLVVLMVVVRLVTVISGYETVQPREGTSPLEMAEQIAQSMVTQVAMLGTLFVAVVALSRATPRDVGLPASGGELRGDLAIAAVAWLAALLPVYGLQGFLVKLGGEKSSHPLIQMVLDDSHALVLSLAFLAAVVVAPICEEIAFRLLVQGWLEKLEDQWLGWRTNAAPVEATTAAGENCVSQPPATPEPPGRGLAGLPHGWAPIVAASVIFAAGHAGHGPDPIPLFVLALILGYVYQRTHRIVPCIVTHMLFNLTTLISLYWAVSYHRQ